MGQNLFDGSQIVFLQLSLIQDVKNYVEMKLVEISNGKSFIITDLW